MDLRLEIEITKEDLELILGEKKSGEVETFCPNCRAMRRMQAEAYWLNHIGDVSLEGHCSHCDRALTHYLDTGIQSDSYDKAMAMRELKMQILNDYNARPYKPQQY